MAPEEQCEWRRVHWASPIVRGWIIILVVGIGLVRNSGEDLVRHGFSFHPDEFIAFISSSVGLRVLLGAVGALLLLALLMYAKWLTTRFCITDDHIYLRRGILFRSRQQLRLDRIQGIDMEQPLLARLLGLAEMSFVTADGTGEKTFSLAYLSTKEAKDLRLRLLAESRAAEPEVDSVAVRGSDAAAEHAQPGVVGQQRPEAPLLADADPGQTIFRVGTARAIGAYLLSGSVAYVAVYLLTMGILAAIPLDVTRDFAAGLGAVLLPQLLGFGMNAVSTLPKRMRFAIEKRGSRFVLSQGLASTSAKALRPERIHAVRVEQPLLWRIPGWYRVKIVTPGEASTDEDEAGGQLVPVGTREEVERVLADIVPQMGLPMDDFLPRDGQDFLRPVPRVRWLTPLQFPRLGARVDTAEEPETAEHPAAQGVRLLTRGGWTRRWIAVVPIRRVQSVSLKQGPLLRLARAASVRVHLVGSADDGHVYGLDVREAERLHALLTRATLDAVRAARLPGGTAPDEPAPVAPTSTL